MGSSEATVSQPNLAQLQTLRAIEAVRTQAENERAVHRHEEAWPVSAPSSAVPRTR